MRAQQASINLATSRRDHITNKLLMPPRSITARYNRSLRYARVRKQRGLNLPRLNPKTADLNLMVRSTHKLQNPVRTPPRQIPAAVHPCPRSTKPVRNKALPAQPSTTQIPTRYPAPRYVKLPNNPNPNRLQTIVQDINAVVRQRPANRNCRGKIIALTATIRGRPDATLSWAVLIYQRNCWEEFMMLDREVRYTWLTGEYHRLQPWSRCILKVIE